MTKPYRPGPITGVSEEVQACFPRSGIIHAYVWWASQTTHAPVWWHVACGLTIVAAEAARLGYVIGEDQEEKPSVWVALIGPSAAGKSTAINRAQDFYRAHLEAENVEVPWVLAEGSTAGIFEKLTDGWNAELGRTLAVVYAEEFARLLDTKQPITEMLMQLADNREMERHLKSAREKSAQGLGNSSHLKNPCLNAILATTYSSLRRVTTAQHLGGGLYSRMLWFCADADPTNMQMLPNKKPAQRREALLEWAEWRKWTHVELMQDGPRIIRVPAAVHHILRDSLFEQAKAHMTAADDRLNPSRVRGITMAYRIAGLFAFSLGRTTVLSEDMDAAVNLIEECQRGLELLDPELGTSDLLMLCNQAFRAIQRQGTDGCKRSALYPILKTNKRTVDEIVFTLIDEGSIREETVRTGKKGRPALRYIACGPKRFAGDPDPDDVVVPLRGNLDAQRNAE